MNSQAQQPVLAAIPRPEHPRPQFVRAEWYSLNGKWNFCVDAGRSGRARGLASGQPFADSILVPFCPESALSGIGCLDFMPAVWYRRTFSLPEAWAGGRILLHFGAVDYEAEVWINGQAAGKHRGGYTPFTFDITERLQSGENTVTVCAEDDNRSGLQPRGKQSAQYHSHGCDYTRTTGIWQTVWLEHVPDRYLTSLKLFPDLEAGSVHLEAAFNTHLEDAELAAEALFAGRPVGSGSVRVCGRQARLTIHLTETHPWQIGDPALYDLTCSLAGGPDRSTAPDRLASYFGLRSVSWNSKAMLLNGKPLFQRLILDQGFYPDGIYTAPSDDELRRDIERSMALGFNGARLHQKIFEERFLYWADRLGYLVWGEHASWGLDISGPAGLERFLPEWLEALERDISHPAIVGWCPFNETNIRQDSQVLATVHAVTKALDPTRPVIDTSGYVHVVTDIYDVHNYDQDVAAFTARFAPLAQGGPVFVNTPGHEQYGGQPYFVSEFGGIWWNPQAEHGRDSWGYGERCRTIEEVYERFEGLCNVLLDDANMFGYCYTQLTDIYQEQNGVVSFDRSPKLDLERLRRAQQRPAAIELADQP